MSDEPHLAIRQKVWQQRDGKWAVLVQARVMNGSRVPKWQILNAGFNHRNEKDARAAAVRPVEDFKALREAASVEERTPWEQVAELPLLKSEYPSSRPRGIGEK